MPKARYEGADRVGGAGSLSSSEGDRGGDPQGHAEDLGAVGLSVLWVEQEVDPGGIEFQMTRDSEGGDTAAAERPSTQKSNDQPVAIVQISASWYSVKNPSQRR